MSRYISVLGLAARSCFLKGLAIMVVSVLLSGLLLYLLPEGVERESYMDENGVVQWIYEAYDLSEIPDVSRAAAPLAVGFGLLCTVMARTGGGKGAKTAYTVGRLRVKPGTVRRLWTGYYFMMLVLYWAMAAAMLYGVMRYRVGLAAESMDIGPQSLVLAFYGSNLLHHILPISDFFAWIGGIVGLLACAVGCMDVAQKEWTGQVGGPLMGIAVALTLGSFWVPMEGSRILVGIVIGEMVVIGAALISWSGGDTCEEAVDDWRA